MPVDFFITPCANTAGNCTTYPLPCLTNIPYNRFGITDEDGGNSTPARVDNVDPTIWDLTVINNSGVNVMFKAVDWCVPIYRTGTYNLDDETRTAAQFSSDNIGTELIKRCEGFLQFNSKILFIEIKKQGTNINQIARALNNGSSAELGKFEEFTAEYKKLNDLIGAIVGKL